MVDRGIQLNPFFTTTPRAAATRLVRGDVCPGRIPNGGGFRLTFTSFRAEVQCFRHTRFGVDEPLSDVLCELGSTECRSFRSRVSQWCSRFASDRQIVDAARRRADGHIAPIALSVRILSAVS